MTPATNATERGSGLDSPALTAAPKPRRSTRLSLDNRPKSEDVLGFKDVPDFRMRVIHPYNKIGQVKVLIHGAEFYATYAQLIQAGAFYLRPKAGR